MRTQRPTHGDSPGTRSSVRRTSMSVGTPSWSGVLPHVSHCGMVRAQYVLAVRVGRRNGDGHGCPSYAYVGSHQPDVMSVVRVCHEAHSPPCFGSPQVSRFSTKDRRAAVRRQDMTSRLSEKGPTYPPVLPAWALCSGDTTVHGKGHPRTVVNDHGCYCERDSQSETTRAVVHLQTRGWYPDEREFSIVRACCAIRNHTRPLEDTLSGKLRGKNTGSDMTDMADADT